MTMMYNSISIFLLIPIVLVLVLKICSLIDLLTYEYVLFVHHIVLL